jgi:diacylglycerol kinase family enzyme
VKRTFVENVKVSCENRMYLQIDGEPFSIDDDRNYEFSVLRKAATLLIPPRRKRKRH